MRATSNSKSDFSPAVDIPRPHPARPPPVPPTNTRMQQQQQESPSHHNSTPVLVRAGSSLSRANAAAAAAAVADSPSLRLYSSARKTATLSPRPMEPTPLSTHTAVQWSHDLMVDPRSYLFLAVGDVVEIRSVPGQSSRHDSDSDSEQEVTQQSSSSTPGNNLNSANGATNSVNSNAATSAAPAGAAFAQAQQQSVLVQVTTLEPPLGRVHLSLNKWMASAAGFNQYAMVVVHKLSEKELVEAHASSVVLCLRGAYASRGELWLMKRSLFDRPLMVGKVSSIGGVEFRVEEMRAAGGSAKLRSGIVGPDTQVVFRSGSARIVWLVQVSKEMFDFADDGDLLHERLFGALMPEILDKWNADRARHSLQVVFFTRTVFNGVPGPGLVPKEALIPDAATPRHFVDLFQIALPSCTRSDWRSVIPTILSEFAQFSVRARWAVDGGNGVCGLPSAAMEGNFVQAVNMALAETSTPYVDRDLGHTGTSIVVFTPGSGVFELDAPLAKLTENRLSRLGVPHVDVVSLTMPPLHHAPLLVLRSSLERRTPEEGEMADLSLDPGQTSTSQPALLLTCKYVVPKWISLCFPFAADQSEHDQSQARAARAVARMRGLPVSGRVPLPESRMYSIPDPSRGSISSALLSSLERARVGRATSPGPFFLGSFSTWANVRRIPRREDLVGWYPPLSALDTPDSPVAAARRAPRSKRRLGDTGGMSPSLVALQAYSGVGAQSKAATPSWIAGSASSAARSTALPAASAGSMSMAAGLVGMGSSSQGIMLRESADRQEILDRQRRYDARTFTHGGGSTLKELARSEASILAEELRSPSLRAARAQSTSNLAMLAMTPSRVGLIQLAAGKGAADQADVLLPERSPARGIKWMEMTTPELVTLTTDYAPSDRALYNDCHWTTYSFEIMSPMRFESVLALLSELMCQRLSHNFQVYVGESDKTAVLVCGPVVHALSVSAQRIDVTNWEPREAETEKIRYAFLLWNSIPQRYEMVESLLASVDAVAAWNHLDTAVFEDDEVTKDFMDCITLLANLNDEQGSGVFVQTLKRRFPAVIDVEAPKRGIREKEWLYFNCDAELVEGRAYKIQIHWVAASTKAVDALWGEVEKLAETCKVRLAQVPSVAAGGHNARLQVDALPAGVFVPWNHDSFVSKDGRLLAIREPRPGDGEVFFVRGNPFCSRPVSTDEEVIKACGGGAAGGAAGEPRLLRPVT